MTSVWIELEEMKFYAYHGVFEQERRVGNNFVVSLRVKASVEESLECDELDRTISYADLYELVKDEMNKPSSLLEHVAGRIRARVFDFSSRISALDLKVTKLNPPFSGEVHSASVHLQAER